MKSIRICGGIGGGEKKTGMLMVYRLAEFTLQCTSLLHYMIIACHVISETN